jgi:hypothetical protein
VVKADAIETSPQTARIAANVRGAPNRSDAQPATMRPTGAIQIAELASRPRSLTVR